MRPLLAVSAVVMLAAVTAQSAVINKVNKSFNVADGGHLTLDADIGEIRVTSGGTGLSVEVIRNVHATSAKRAAELEKDFVLDFKQTGNDVHIKATYDRGFPWFSFGDPMQVTYVIRVPARYNVELRTAGGNISVADLTGNVSLRTAGGDARIGHIGGSVSGTTSGGDITMASAAGNVSVKTAGGDIETGDVGGTVEAHTSGGSIRVGRIGGSVELHTAGGSITLADAHSAVNASTSGGSITAHLTGPLHGDSKISTMGGGLSITLAANVSADLDARAMGGDVDASLPITLLEKSSDSKIVGKVNGGGPHLVLRSSGGGIRLSRG